MLCFITLLGSSRSCILVGPCCTNMKTRVLLQHPPSAGATRCVLLPHPPAAGATTGVLLQHQPVAGATIGVLLQQPSNNNTLDQHVFCYNIRPTTTHGNNWCSVATYARSKGNNRCSGTSSVQQQHIATTGVLFYHSSGKHTWQQQVFGFNIRQANTRVNNRCSVLTSARQQISAGKLRHE